MTSSNPPTPAAEGRTRRVFIVEHFDPERPVPSGIDSVIIGMVRYGEGYAFDLVGVTGDAQRELGRWVRIDLAGRQVNFMPVARLDRNLRSRIPHSFQFIAGLLRYRRTLRGLKRRNSRSVWHAHRLETGLALSLLRLNPVAQFIHNSRQNLTGRSSDSIWRRLPFVYAAIERRHLPGCAAVVAFNKDESERLRHLNSSVFRGETWFDPKIYEASREPKNGRAQIVWVGRLDEQKDPRLAVLTLRSLIDAQESVHLTIVGDGPHRSALLALAHDLGVSDRVTFLGAVSREKVPSLLASSDVFLMTSHYEGSPTVIVEALASGLPVVATEGGDPDDLVSAEVGARASSRSPSDLAQLVVKVLRQKPRAARCRDAVAHRVAVKVVPQLLVQTAANIGRTS